MKNKQSGYVTLITVLIVSAIALAINVATLTTGTDSQRLALTEQRSKQARALAIACTQEALRIINLNIVFSGTNVLSTPQGACTYSVAITNATTRSILASSTTGDVVKKIQVYATINQENISIYSWQEVN